MASTFQERASVNPPAFFASGSLSDNPAPALGGLNPATPSATIGESDSALIRRGNVPSQTKKPRTQPGHASDDATGAEPPQSRYANATFDLHASGWDRRPTTRPGIPVREAGRDIARKTTAKPNRQGVLVNGHVREGQSRETRVQAGDGREDTRGGHWAQFSRGKAGRVRETSKPDTGETR